MNMGDALISIIALLYSNESELQALLRKLETCKTTTSLWINLKNNSVKKSKPDDRIYMPSLNSFKVLDSLKIFSELKIDILLIKCPKTLSMKLIFTSNVKFTVSLNLFNSNLAYQLLFKCKAKRCTVHLKNIENIVPLLPLFIPKSKRIKFHLPLLKCSLNRLQLKVTLKYMQMFKIYETENMLLISSQEVMFLNQNSNLCVYPARAPSYIPPHLR